MSKGKRELPREGTATYRVWEEVAAHGPLSSKEIAERTGIRHLTVSSVAQNLIDRGLLERDEKTEKLKLP